MSQEQQKQDTVATQSFALTQLHLNLMTKSGRRGRSAENLSIWYLKQRGFHILCRNFNCKLGEIDIIAIDPKARFKTIHFIEVKTRMTHAHALPQSAVTRSKQNKICAAGRYWMLKTRQKSAVYLFDVIAIAWPKRGIPHIRWFKNAFYMTDAFGWHSSSYF